MNKGIPKIVICEKCGTENSEGTTHCVKCGEELYHDYYRGLQLRNTLITLGLFLLPFVIFFYILNFETSRHFEDLVKQQLSYSVEVNARAIKTFLEERKHDLLSIATMDVAEITDVRTRRTFLQRFLKEKPSFDFIAAADPSGKMIFSTNDLRGTVDKRIYFRKSMTGEFYNSGIFYSDILDTSAMIISTPLYNRNDRQIGVILASISLKALYDLILDLRIGRTSEIFLVDENGIFLSPSRLGGTVLKEYGYYSKDANPHADGGGVLIHRDYRGENVICAYRSFEEFHGYLVSEMDVDEALAPVARLKSVIFYIFLIFGGFLVFSSVFFSRQVTNVLKNLTGALKSALDDAHQKKTTIDTINAELRKRLRDCESLSKQLRVSEEYIKNIINSISSGVVAFDRELRITYYNDFVRTLSGMKDIEINTNLYEALPLLKNDVITKAIDDIFTHKEPFYIMKTSVSSDDRDYIFSISGFPIRHETDISGATLLMNDITKEVKMQAQMADYEKLSALSQVALGAAHEINNPLLGITSYIELLIEEEKDVERRTQAKQVLDSAYRISETIKGLLNFARPSPPSFTKININKLISETISFLNHQPLFRKIKFQKQLADSLPHITADANQVRQVLLNIFLNAGQAMPEGGIIAVMTNKVKFEEQIEIRINDTGVGISDEDLKRVFDPFFTTKKGEGTGLGLSISYSYVKSHKGQIAISSSPGKGTEVALMLPIRQETRTKTEVLE
ncbi:MAG: ATP-binding protein [candidate division WOR-3 bacterium]|nr:ATP-binding protein [candidate division WOR-3 bacterium]